MITENDLALMREANERHRIALEIHKSTNAKIRFWSKVSTVAMIGWAIGVLMVIISIGCTDAQLLETDEKIADTQVRAVEVGDALTNIGHIVNSVFPGGVGTALTAIGGLLAGFGGAKLQTRRAAKKKATTG